MAPKRIQRKRNKGWRMPPNTVYIGRGTEFGNPFKVGWYFTGKKESSQGCYSYLIKAAQQKDDIGWIEITTKFSVELFKACLVITKAVDPEKYKKVLGKLRGKNLACWCPLDQPCHADVLLELANNKLKGISSDADSNNATE